MAAQFVCVRVQSMNGRDVGLFQFDYDLTFMAFFMDAHDRFYARYGGREDDDSESHLSQKSLVRTMKAVLDLHREGRVRSAQTEPPAPTQRIPEDDPSVAKMIAKRKPGNRCIHCHDVKVGELVTAREAGTFNKAMVRGYPSPRTLGLQLDRDDQRQLAAVAPESPAAHAGLQTGDVLKSVDGERVLTFGDFTRSLHLAPRVGTLTLAYDRQGKAGIATVRLEGDWRGTADPSWRASTHWAGPNGGFWGVALDAAEKQGIGVPADGLALRLTFFFNNQPGPIQAGLQLRDVIVEIDGQRRAMSPRQLHAHLQLHREFGDKVGITVKRGEQELKLTLPLPDKPPPLE